MLLDRVSGIDAGTKFVDADYYKKRDESPDFIKSTGALGPSVTRKDIPREPTKCESHQRIVYKLERLNHAPTQAIVRPFLTSDPKQAVRSG